MRILIEGTGVLKFLKSVDCGRWKIFFALVDDDEGVKLCGNSKHTLDILRLVASPNESYAMNRGWNILMK